MNEIAAIEKYTLPAISKARGKNYEVSIPGKEDKLILQRDVDFGKFGQAKTPSLLKAGAEKILGAYGVAQEYTVEKAIEEWNGDIPFFFYRIKCTLFTYINGERYNLTDGFGSASTMEKQCGRASGIDTANARLKMAKKRAMVDACLMLAQLSSCFTQDMESDDFADNKEFKPDVTKAEAVISAKQMKRMFSIAGTVGKTDTDVKSILAEFGYSSSKEVLNKDYDAIIDKISEVIK